MPQDQYVPAMGSLIQMYGIVRAIVLNSDHNIATDKILRILKTGGFSSYIHHIAMELCTKNIENAHGN